MGKTKKQKKTTAKRPIHIVYRDRLAEADGVYFLKLIIVVLLSTLWIKLRTPISWNDIPFGAFPLGALVALVGVRLFENNSFDRKIWYAVIVMVAILSYFVPAGIVL